MKSRKIIRTMLIMTIAGIIIGGCAELHSFLLPDRDVQKLPAEYQVTASGLTAEFLNDTDQASLKYLSDDGESKILEITGKVSRITENFNGERVVFLQNDDDKAATMSLQDMPRKACYTQCCKLRFRDFFQITLNKYD